MRYIILSAFCIIAAIGSAQDSTALASVIYGVHDGDSYYFRAALPARRTYRIAGVDCPEVFGGYVSAEQPRGREVADSVRALIKGRNVQYNIIGIDKYKRPLVVVYVDSTDLAETILRKGWGWYYKAKQLPPEVRKKYSNLASSAKKAKRGIWQDKDIVRPEIWRKQHPMPQ